MQMFRSGYQQPAELLFLCKLREGKTKLRDLGMGCFKRHRDEDGFWDGETWDLVADNVRVEGLAPPNIEYGYLIRRAIIQPRRNGGYKVACQVGKNRHPLAWKYKYRNGR